MDRSRLLASIAAIIAITAPASAAILYQTSVTADGGIAELFDASTLPALISPGTIWIGVSRGAVLDSGSWLVDGELQKLWWDPMGGGFDSDGNPIPALTGNEYIYSPECGSSLASPVCGGVPLRTTLAGNYLRIDFAPPPDSNTCPATYQGSDADCAFYYRFNYAQYDIFAGGRGQVTFTFYDSLPAVGTVPEPAGWALLVAGFGLTGAVLRRRTRLTSPPG